MEMLRRTFPIQSWPIFCCDLQDLGDRQILEKSIRNQRWCRIGMRGNLSMGVYVVGNRRSNRQLCVFGVTFQLYRAHEQPPSCGWKRLERGRYGEDLPDEFGITSSVSLQRVHLQTTGYRLSAHACVLSRALFHDRAAWDAIPDHRREQRAIYSR